MTKEELDALKREYEAESFPGLEVSMEDITSMMTAPDPGAAVGAKAISAAGDKAGPRSRSISFISALVISGGSSEQVTGRLSQGLDQLYHQVLAPRHFLLQTPSGQDGLQDGKILLSEAEVNIARV